MENPSEIHLNAARKVLRYVNDYGVFYKKEYGTDLVGYTDSDYARDLDDHNSTLGHVFMLNSSAISWTSKKKQIVTLSTTKAEFVAVALSSCQALWHRKMFEVLGEEQKGPTIIYCDNMSTIKLSKNPIMHGRSKNIDVRFHFLRDLYKDEKIDLQYCRSGEQIVDILTKPLKQPAFEKLRKMLGVCSTQSIDLGEELNEEDHMMKKKS